MEHYVIALLNVIGFEKLQGFLLKYAIKTLTIVITGKEVYSVKNNLYN